MRPFDQPQHEGSVNGYLVETKYIPMKWVQTELHRQPRDYESPALLLSYEPENDSPAGLSPATPCREDRYSGIELRGD